MKGIGLQHIRDCLLITLLNIKVVYKELKRRGNTW